MFQYSGKLIVFEGGEGCGKTTQIRLAQKWLMQAHPFDSAASPLPLSVTREPGGTQLCRRIRQVLLTPCGEIMDPRTELLLYAADRTQHVERCLKPTLEQGRLVLCDRYTDSTVAYQGFGRRLDRALIDRINAIATGGLQPDLTLWLDLDAEQGLTRAKSRGKRDRIEQSDLSFHQSVRQGFVALAQDFPNRIVRVDASGDIASVSQRVQSAISEAYKRWDRPDP